MENNNFKIVIMSIINIKKNKNTNENSNFPMKALKYTINSKHYVIINVQNT